MVGSLQEICADADCAEGTSCNDAGVCVCDTDVDCAGTCGGSAVLSGCDNTCGSTAVVDCAGTCGGSAVDNDGNGVCDEDETGGDTSDPCDPAPTNAKDYINNQCCQCPSS